MGYWIEGGMVRRGKKDQAAPEDEVRVDAPCYKTILGLSIEETKEFKRLGKLTMGEIQEIQYERYKFLLHKTLDGFSGL